MACKCSSKKSTEIKLTEEQEKILRALAEATEPIACKDIAAATDIPSKSVSCRLKSLKTKGLIESPQRCRYTATDAGKKFVSATC